jgi:hypothetical protein
MKINKYLIAIFFLSLLKITYSYFIPFNILANAIHDDFLFYRLGESIASGNWLGRYDNTTLIKGFVYPGFISISILTHIPLRILESVLICISALYLISFLGLLKLSKAYRIILYAFIIFYPLQYSSIDFRLLRDAIYPQLLILIFVSLFYLAYYQKYLINIKPVIIYFHIFIFIISSYLFLNTREEGIWITPALVFIFSILVFLCNKYKNTLFLLKLVFVIIISLSSLNILLKYVNKHYYDFYISTTFKDENFQSGYGSLHRINNNKLLYDSVTREEWNSLFKVSPAVAELKNYINGPGYDGWAKMACEALNTQGINISESGCSNDMPIGFLMFSLLDGIWEIGYRSPSKVSEYMQRVTVEIDYACNSGSLNCRTIPKNMMPPALTGGNLDYYSIFKNIINSFLTTINFSSPNIFTYFSSGDLNTIKTINKNIGGYVFPIKESISESIGLCQSPTDYKVNSGNPGFIDGIEYKDSKVYIYGWALNKFNTKFSNIEIVSNGSKICSVKPSISRPDILPSNSDDIGFTCIVPNNFTSYVGSNLNAFALDDKSKNKYLLNRTDNVILTLSNGVIYNSSFSIKQYIGDFFNLNSFLYSKLIKLLLYFVPLILMFFLYKKYYLVLFFMLTLILLYLSRISLLSILYYLGLAPANPLYLNSASYILFIICSITFVYLLSIAMSAMVFLNRFFFKQNLR